LPRPAAGRARDRRRSLTTASLTPLVLLCSSALLAQQQTAGPMRQPEAVSLARRSMAAMGGEERWAGSRLLRFDFSSRREGKAGATYRHWWDRQTGDYRVEGTDRDGRQFRAHFDVDTRQGRGWRDGRELAGAELAQLLEMAYGRYINDTYWLLMPWKWLDPGVNLAYEGRRQIDGKELEVVALSFGSGIGLTSNDRYWAFVSPSTGRMERWAFVLQDEQGAPGAGEPTAWAWEDWKTTDAGIELSTVRRRLGGPDVQILFPVAEAWANPSAEQLREAFAPPAPPQPE
jgi:hypothetical protein